MSIEKKEKRLSQIIIDFDAEQIKIVVATDFEDSEQGVVATRKSSIISKRTSRKSSFVDDLKMLLPEGSLDVFLSKVKSAYSEISNVQRFDARQLAGVEFNDSEVKEK